MVTMELQSFCTVLCVLLRKVPKESFSVMKHNLQWCEKKNKSWGSSLKILSGQREGNISKTLHAEAPSTFLGPQSPTKEHSAGPDWCSRPPLKGIFYCCTWAPAQEKWFWLTCPDLSSSGEIKVAACQFPWKDSACFSFSLPLLKTHRQDLHMVGSSPMSEGLKFEG